MWCLDGEDSTCSTCMQKNAFVIHGIYTRVVRTNMVCIQIQLSCCPFGLWRVGHLKGYDVRDARKYGGGDIQLDRNDTTLPLRATVE
jgi:hypothetical protein